MMLEDQQLSLCLEVLWEQLYQLCYHLLNKVLKSITDKTILHQDLI